MGIDRRLTLYVKIMIVGAVLLAIGILNHVGGSQPQNSAHASSQQSSCNWHDEMYSTITKLGSNPDVWMVSSLYVGNAWGTTSIGDENHDPWVAISPDIACSNVDDVVSHEWMHLQLIAMPGNQPHDEYIADCGAELLGANYTPYLSEVRTELQYDPCQGKILEIASSIVNNLEKS